MARMEVWKAACPPLMKEEISSLLPAGRQYEAREAIYLQEVSCRGR